MFHLLQHRYPFREQGSKFCTFWISFQVFQTVTFCLISWLEVEISEKLVFGRGPDLCQAKEANDDQSDNCNNPNNPNFHIWKLEETLDFFVHGIL